MVSGEGELMVTTGIEMLRHLPFLEGAGLDVFERLAEIAVERTFHPGQVIIEEGSTGREIYLVAEGLVEVVRGEGDEAIVLAQRGAGELLGEMGFIEGAPRFATVRAVEPTRMYEFSEQALADVLAEKPMLLYRLVRALSARLRETDLQMIADLQRKNEELARAYRELQAAQSALVEKERLERELELARELQQSFLPHEFPRVPGFSCAAASRPARQVGGDLYDVIPLSGGRVGLVIADVSDKGMPAALYMALTRSLTRAEAHRSPSPRQVLLNVNRLLLETSQADMFVTLFYGVLDPARRTLRYARAGHDYPLLLRPASGECQLLKAMGMLLGAMEEIPLEEATVDLAPGDLLVLYTDGMTDATAPAGGSFGLERLREMVCTAGSLGAQELCDLLFQRVDEFQGPAVQYDDMSLLVAKLGDG
jgi:sigma-B regulation protein RsbU (phosphoserine phosphatase)